MKIILNPQGSHGDVRPLITLGLALRQRGHEIEICSSPNHEAFVTQYQFPFHPVGMDIQKILEEHTEAMNKPGKTMSGLLQVIHADFADQFTNLQKAAVNADLLIGCGISSAVMSIAEYYHIPFYQVWASPTVFKSCFHPPGLIPYHSFPKWFNRFLWWGYGGILNKLLLKNLNEKRLKIGLTPVNNWMAYSLQNVIVIADGILGPVPPDVRNYAQTGYWHLTEDGELNEDLIQFIVSGPPPIYFGFGSMTDPAPAKTKQIIQEIIASERFRIVLSKGWAKLGIDEINPHVFLADYVPHSRLFPKMATIVHHGGCGTVHTAAVAGVPQVIVPHMFDQYYWGNRIMSLKLGPKPINRTKLTSQNLLESIDKAVTNPDYKQNASQISKILKQHNGINEALDIIENTLKQKN